MDNVQITAYTDDELLPMPWRLQIAARILAETVGYASYNVYTALELADKLIKAHEETAK